MPYIKPTTDPSPEQQHKHATVATEVELFVELAEGITPASRERSLAITKAEEAGMWLNRAIALEHRTIESKD